MHLYNFLKTSFVLKRPHLHPVILRYAGCLLLIFCLPLLSEAQKKEKADSKQTIKTFNRVMEFAVQPQLYYATTTQLSSDPLLNSTDSMTIESEFFKDGSTIFSKNNYEEIYVDDSFYVAISHLQKVISINRVQKDLLKTMNRLPLMDKDMEELFKKSYSMESVALNRSQKQINFYSEDFLFPDSTNVQKTNVQLQYDFTSFLPVSMVIDIHSKQFISAEIAEQLLAEGPSYKELVKQQQNSYFIERSQKMRILFNEILLNKKKALLVPTWQQTIAYSKEQASFVIKDEKLFDYEIENNL